MAAEIEQSTGGLIRQGEEYATDQTTITVMLHQLDLGERDQFCYLFDYGDEWRFYAIFKEINQDLPSDAIPEVVKQRGKPGTSTLHRENAFDHHGQKC